MIGIVATLRVKEGSQAEFETVMGELIQQVRAKEPGCQLYTLTLTQGSTTEYVMMELYRDKAATEAHRASDHFRAGAKKMMAFLDGPADIKRMDVKL